jgi:hypothetical protein
VQKRGIWTIWFRVSIIMFAAFVIGLHGWGWSGETATVYWGTDHRGATQFSWSRGWPCGVDNRWTEVKPGPILSELRCPGVLWRDWQLNAHFNPNKADDPAPTECGAEKWSTVRMKSLQISGVYLMILLVSVPAWQFVLSIRGGFVLQRRQSRAHRGLCQNCGYDLRVGHQRCPECGILPARASDPRYRHKPA